MPAERAEIGSTGDQQLIAHLEQMFSGKAGISVPEVAKVRGRSVATVWRDIAQGRLDSYLDGGRRRVYVTSLIALLRRYLAETPKVGKSRLSLRAKTVKPWLQSPQVTKPRRVRVR
jgi:hypothetical protein